MNIINCTYIAMDVIPEELTILRKDRLSKETVKLDYQHLTTRVSADNNHARVTGLLEKALGELVDEFLDDRSFRIVGQKPRTEKGKLIVKKEGKHIWCQQINKANRLVGEQFMLKIVLKDGFDATKCPTIELTTAYAMHKNQPSIEERREANQRSIIHFCKSLS